jgi:GMP synthase (glutamine-hydrolysing)
MRAHFVIHEAFEAPGAYETWVRDRGFQATYSRVYLHEPLPAGADAFDLLIVMGGPQSPATTREECAHFDSLAEQALIREAIAANKAVVGVCLGAQLIGEALGAPHARSPETEIGNFSITLTEAGRANTKLASFTTSLEVGHWHGDMPGLTADASVLATSEGCPRQIVEYTPRVYGFQCHMEFTPEVVELLIAASEDELRAKAHHPYVQSPATLRANHFDAMNRQLFSFLDALAAAR